MFLPRIIPCLLIKNMGLVKTIGFKDEIYLGDPMNAIRLFSNFEADELIILDVDAHKEGRTIDVELVRNIGEEASMPFAVGGGIKTLDDARLLIAAGAEKVILGSVISEAPSLVREVAESFGSQSVVACVDVKKDMSGGYKVLVRGATQPLACSLEDYLRCIEGMGVGEIMIQSVDLDGTMTGYDISLIKNVMSWTHVPVIACGGAGSYDDLKKVVMEGGASAAAAGSLFVFYGSRKGVLINYPSPKQKQDIFL